MRWTVWRPGAATALFACLGAAATCGGGSSGLDLGKLSPAAPSSPTPTSTPGSWSISGRVSSQSGTPVPAASVAAASYAGVLTDAGGNYTVTESGEPAEVPYPLQVTADNYLRRQVWVSWAQSARTNINVNLISTAAPFSLSYYRELARDAHDEPGSLQPLSLWPGANPVFYIRTVDQNGAAIEASVLSVVSNTIPGAVSAWTNGKVEVASIETGTDTRTRQDGLIVVNISRQTSGTTCGTSYIGALDGEIDLIDGVCTCGTSGIAPQVVAHEVGHAMGFFHVSDPNAIMYPSAIADCTKVQPTTPEAFHLKVAWTRQPGNLDPDLDPSGATPLARRDILVVN